MTDVLDAARAECAGCAEKDLALALDEGDK